MGQKVLWVITERHNDHVFPTLKEAKASTIGFGDWFNGGSNIRIISRIVLYTFRKKGSNVRRT